MADVVPIPPWRIHLAGTEEDLQDLGAEHTLGRTRVIHSRGEYFLEADVLNAVSDCNRAVEKAHGILHVICGLAKVRRFSASPVKATSILWTDGNGNWVGKMSLPTMQYRIVPGAKYLVGEKTSEQILALAETNEKVRINLIDFLGEWDFSRLRRIVRGILVDLGGIKKGADEVVRLGWADESECKRFLADANFGNKDYLGAHSRFERAPDKDAMSLVMTSEFVRKLLARWIASKI